MFTDPGDSLSPHPRLGRESDASEDFAMSIIRLANAWRVFEGGVGMRYVFLGWDASRGTYLVVDAVLPMVGMVRSVSELLDELPEDLQLRVQFS